MVSLFLSAKVFLLHSFVSNYHFFSTIIVISVAIVFLWWHLNFCSYVVWWREIGTLVLDRMNWHKLAVERNQTKFQALMFPKTLLAKFNPFLQINYQQYLSFLKSFWFLSCPCLGTLQRLLQQQTEEENWCILCLLNPDFQCNKLRFF